MKSFLLRIAKVCLLFAGIAISAVLFGVLVGTIQYEPIRVGTVGKFFVLSTCSLAFPYIFAKFILARIAFVLISFLTALAFSGLAGHDIRLDTPHYPFQGANLRDNCLTVERSIYCLKTDLVARTVFAIKCSNIELLTKPSNVYDEICQKGIVVSKSKFEAMIKGKQETRKNLCKDWDDSFFSAKGKHAL